MITVSGVASTSSIIVALTENGAPLIRVKVTTRFPRPLYTLTVPHATATHNLSEGDYSPQAGSQPIPVLTNTFDINLQKSCSFATMHIVKRAHLDTDVTAPS